MTDSSLFSRDILHSLDIYSDNLLANVKGFDNKFEITLRNNVGCSIDSAAT